MNVVGHHDEATHRPCIRALPCRDDLLRGGRIGKNPLPPMGTHGYEHQDRFASSVDRRVMHRRAPNRKRGAPSLRHPRVHASRTPGGQLSVVAAPWLAGGAPPPAATERRPPGVRASIPRRHQHASVVEGNASSLSRGGGGGAPRPAAATERRPPGTGADENPR